MSLTLITIYLCNIKLRWLLCDNGVSYICTLFSRFNGSRAILSGPAGGVVGYAVTTYKRETDLPVIGFDMGGNVMFQSCCVSRVRH